MSLLKQLNAGFRNQDHSTLFLGDGTKVSFIAGVEAKAVKKVEAWVSNAWAERTLKTGNTGEPAAGEYVFTNPMNDTITVKYGTAPTAPVVQVDTIAFAAKADHESDEYFIISAQDGTKYGCLLDITGAEVEPTSAAWLACDATVICDLSNELIVSDAEVATAIKASLDSITGIETKITIGITTNSISLTQLTGGECAIPVSYGFTGTVNVTIAQTQKGVTKTSRIIFEQGATTLIQYLNPGF